MRTRDPGATPVRAPERSQRWFDLALVALFVASLGAMLAGVWLARPPGVLVLERRNMHPWPTTADSGYREWTAGFERAFGDRFGGRGVLTRLHHALKVALGASPVDNVMLGRAGWLFFLGEDARALDRHYRGVAPLGTTVDAVVGEFERRNAALASRGIAYIVVVVPDKFSVYDEHLPRWVVRATATPLDRIAAAMKDRADTRFLDLRAPLRAAKTTRRVYFRTDSHWNLIGASIGYEALMDEVRRALPGRMASPVPAPRPPYDPQRDRYSGDLATMLGSPSWLAEEDLAPLWKVYADASRRCAKRFEDDATVQRTGRETFECDAPRPRAMILRDSMAIPWLPLVSENFSRTVWLATRRLDLQLVDAERPDVVVDQLVERSLGQVAAMTMVGGAKPAVP